LNPLERARAFKKLIDEFNLRQRGIEARIGKSREFIGNSIRILALPENIQSALSDGRINEGHTRPLLMLVDRPDEQQKLFDDIIYKGLKVRDAENAARSIAVERVRKKDDFKDAETKNLEAGLSRVLGTRVSIERNGPGGKIAIDFFSPDELYGFFRRVAGDIEVAPASHNAYDTELDVTDDRSAGDKEKASEPDTEDDSSRAERDRSQAELDPAQSHASEEDLQSFTI